MGAVSEGCAPHGALQHPCADSHGWFGGSSRALFPQSRQAQTVSLCSQNTCSTLLSDRRALSLPRKRIKLFPLHWKGPWAGRLFQGLCYIFFILGCCWVRMNMSLCLCCPVKKSASQLTVLDVLSHNKALCSRNNGVSTLNQGFFII